MFYNIWQRRKSIEILLMHFRKSIFSKWWTRRLPPWGLTSCKPKNKIFSPKIQPKLIWKIRWVFQRWEWNRRELYVVTCKCGSEMKHSLQCKQSWAGGECGSVLCGFTEHSCIFYVLGLMSDAKQAEVFRKEIYFGKSLVTFGRKLQYFCWVYLDHHPKQ